MTSKFWYVRAVLRALRDHAGASILLRWLRWGPYRRMSESDRARFAKVLSAWRPSQDRPAFLLAWFVTSWCNYRCPYCEQPHDRAVRVGRHAAHAFDNYPVERWLEAFARHFADGRLSVVLTGGEPMLDKKNMLPLLKGLTAMPSVECVRIDSNASWSPLAYRDLDPSKIHLMLTYHPSQVSEESFFSRLDQMRRQGFRIGMVNYVATSDNLARYYETKSKLMERGVPLHPNPLWDSKGRYSEEELVLLRRELPPLDYAYRSGTVSPRRKKCLYPALSYEMHPSGRISVGCHPHVSGHFFSQQLPSLFAGPVPCPAAKCDCLYKYSFLGEVNRNVSLNPLQVYSELLISRPAQQADAGNGGS